MDATTWVWHAGSWTSGHEDYPKCMPHLTQPYDMVGPIAWEHTLVNEDFPFEDGAFVVTDRPGLGYTFDHAAVREYLVEKRVFEVE